MEQRQSAVAYRWQPFCGLASAISNQTSQAHQSDGYGTNHALTELTVPHLA